MWTNLLHQCHSVCQVSVNESANDHADDLAGLDSQMAADALAARYEPIIAPLGNRPRVIAQLGQSLDGRIATATGESHFVTGSADRTHLHRLRALSDAVLIGAGTLVADDPQLTVRAVSGPNPTRIIVANCASLPAKLRVFTDGAAPTWCIGPLDLSYAGVDRWFDFQPANPATMISALAKAGIKRLLVEGGARTVSAWLAAGLVDYLYLTIAPIIIGSGPRGLELPAIDQLDAALRPAVRRFTLGEDTLYRLNFNAE